MGEIPTKEERVRRMIDEWIAEDSKAEQEIAKLRKKLNGYAVVSIVSSDKVERYVCNECESAWEEVEWHLSNCPCRIEDTE